MKPTGSNSFKGRRSRTGRSLGEDLEKRVASYVAAASAAEVGSRARSPQAGEVITRAASAAGVGLLLTAGPATARIVYTPAYVELALATSHFLLDLNHDGIADFSLRIGYLAGATVHAFVFPVQAGNGILGKRQAVLSNYYGAPYTCRVASALPAGHHIGPGSEFGAYRTMNFVFFSGRTASAPHFGLFCGSWRNANGGFLGLEFIVQGQKHFGWARFNSSLTLTGYAYETEPNKPIRAGDTGPVADVRVPEVHSAPTSATTLQPATLGLLALGSAGLDIWRKEL